MSRNRNRLSVAPKKGKWRVAVAGLIKVRDPFQILAVGEIVDSLQEVSRFPLSDEAITRPSQQYVVALYGDIIEYFVGISSEHLRAFMEDAAEQVDVENGSNQLDACVTLGLLSHMQKFLSVCGINDFSLSDMVRPESKRLIRILSAIIDYGGYREARMRDMGDFMQEYDEKKTIHEDILAERDDIANRVADLEKQLESNERKVKETTDHHAKVEAELRSLKKIQEALTDECSEYRANKQRLIDTLREQSVILVKKKQDYENLRSCVANESPEKLQESVNQLESEYQDARRSAEELEVQVTTLDHSIQSTEVVTQELLALNKVVDECIAEVQRERTAQTNLTQYEDALEARKKQIAELEREIGHISRQLQSFDERLARKRQEYEKKTVEHKALVDRNRSELAKAMMYVKITNTNMEDMKRQLAYLDERIPEIHRELDKETHTVASECRRLQQQLLRYVGDIRQRLAG